MKKRERELLIASLAPMNLLVIAAMASSLIRNVIGKRVSETEKREEERFLRYYHLLSIEKRFMRGGKGVMRAGNNNLDKWIKMLSSAPSFNQY